MRKNRFLSVCLVALATAAFFPSAGGCRREKRSLEEAAVEKLHEIDKIDRNTQEISSGKLRILSATPSGRTTSPHEAETVVVIFDRPVVPLQASDTAEASSHTSPFAQPVLKFDPPTDGRYRWVGTRALAFTPAQRFPFATEIKVMLPAGLTAVDGSRLDEDFRWTFTTIVPRLVRHFPSHGQRWLRLDIQVLLIFNQPMDKERASPFISWLASSPSPLSREALTEKNKEATPQPKTQNEVGESISCGRSLSFEVSHPDPERLKDAGIELPSDHALLLTLSRGEKLVPGTACHVILKKGLPGGEGFVGMDKDYSFSFETFGSFRFEGLIDPKLPGESPRSRKIRPLSSTPPMPFSPSRPLSPDESLQLKFTNPVAYKELVSRMEFEPPVEIPDYYASWDYSHDVLYLSLPLVPETAYTLRLPADLTDEFGNKLGQPVSVRFRTGSFAPSVSMTTGHGVIEAYAVPTPSYPIQAINQTSILVQAARLSSDAVIPLLRQPKLFWSNEKFTGLANFFQLEKTVRLSLPRNQRRTVPIDLSELFSPLSRHGLIFLQVDTNIQEAKWDRYLKVFLQVTELGISAKFSAENNVIWVTELKTGLPVSGAALELRDDSNRIRWQGQTDASGKAETPGWKKLGITAGQNEYSEPRQWVFASRGDDIAFTSSEWGTGLDPYRFRIAYDWLPEPVTFQGYLFTERGIYRAGERVHIKGIIREKIKGEWTIPARTTSSSPSPSPSPSPGISLDFAITDPFGKVVFKGPVSLDEFGSFDLDLTTAEDCSLGFYQINAVLPSRRPGVQTPEATFSGSFRVEAFRPAEFEVHLRAAAESFVFGRDYEAEIRANYLFGGAMAGQDVSWTLRLNRTFFSPPGHLGYIFGNALDWSEEEVEPSASRLLASGQAQLDAEGKLSIKCPLLAEKEKDSVLATLEATVTSSSRKAISNRIQSLVHRGEFYIGLKPSTSFLRKGDPLTVDVIAASADGQLLPDRKIAVKLVRREWRSVRQAGVGGRFRWRSEKEDIEVESHDIQTGSSPVSISFKPDKSGFYFLLASSTDARRNAITTTTSFYVTGRDYVPWQRSDDDAIELVPDSSSYRPGDKARLLVKSPYERARALVTIEREFVLDARIVDIEGTASSIEIPIRSEHIPNIFVSVLLVHGRAGVEAPGQTQTAEKAPTSPFPVSPVCSLSEDIGMPSFKIGYVNLPVDPAEKRLAVSINNPSPEYRPRDTVTLKLKVQGRDGSPAGRASLAIAVVDVGVLNLIGYETPDPFSAFYGERPLSVRTSETRLHVVGLREYGEKGEEPGGGGRLAEMAAPYSLGEVELRGDFKSTAYWNPSLLTNEQGEASVSFTLPDNLTTFRIMAVAQTKDSRFGRAEISFRVTKKLLLQPSVPRFLRVGDIFEAGVVVHNLTPAKGNVTVGVEVRGIAFLEKKKERRLTLKTGESREVLFAFKAEEPGRASFVFRARLANETDGLELSLPVHLPRPTETVVLAGEVGENVSRTEERIVIPADIFAERSQLEVHASSTALVGLKGSLDFLADYPYACLEQRLSAILPYIVARRLLVDFKLTPLGEKEMDSLVAKGLTEILSFQKESGGFSAWPDSGFESPFLTCYAAFALLKAKEAGYRIDDESLGRVAQYLMNFLRTGWNEARYPFSQRAWKTTRAYALYVLALLGKPQPAFLERLIGEKESLSLFARTLLLRALHHSHGSPTARASLLRELLNKVKVRVSEAHFEDDEGEDGGWIYSSTGRTTALILQTLVELGEDHPLLGPIGRWLVNRQRLTSGGRFASTQENFYFFYALASFYSSREGEAAGLAAKISLDRRPLLEERFSPETSEIKSARLSLAELRPGERPLLIEKTGRGTLYYGARLTYAPRRTAAPRDEGLAVCKRIEPLDSGARAGEGVKAGSLVVVTVEVAVPQESLYVVIDDPLPAGFEAVNTSFLTESEEAARRLAEIIEAAEQAPGLWWRGFNHVEIHDDRVLLFADSLPPGLHTHRYLARALNFGTYLLPGTRAEQMYAPEIFGRSQEALVRVQK